MNPRKRSALEAAGFVFGDAEDFLGLDDEERRLVELRVAVSRKVRQLRERRQWTQAQLAEKLGSSQSRIAKIETGVRGVSLDLMFRGLFAVGGTLADLAAVRARPATRQPGGKSRQKAAAS